MSGFFPASEVQRGKPIGLVAKCGACGLFKNCNSPKMPVHGEGRKQVLIVGESPGQTEDQTGLPFTGEAGQFLRNTLEQLDVDLDTDAWSTNALICKTPRGAAPDAKQIDYCRPNLLNAIAKLRPRVVVLLGRAAVGSLMPVHWKSDVGTLERWVGWKIPGPEHWICPTYHPSFLLRAHNPQLDRAFKQHLEQAFAIDTPSCSLDAPSLRLDDRSAVQLLYEPDDVGRALSRFRDDRWVAVDYETNCLKPELPEARIFSCAVSDGGRTISFPWSAEVKNHMALFFRGGTRKIASNLKFEERWTKRFFGFGVHNWGWDTMLAAHCLDNRPGICSLKFQSWVQLGVPTYNEHIAPLLEGDPYNRIHQIALDDLLYYGGLDALLEYRLAMLQRKEMGL